MRFFWLFIVIKRQCDVRDNIYRCRRRIVYQTIEKNLYHGFVLLRAFEIITTMDPICFFTDIYTHNGHSIFIRTVSSYCLFSNLLDWFLNRLHTVSFDWFLSGLEWILHLEFSLLKLLMFYQKLLWNIRSRLNSSTFWVF